MAFTDLKECDLLTASPPTGILSEDDDDVVAPWMGLDVVAPWMGLDDVVAPWMGLLDIMPPNTPSDGATKTGGATESTYGELLLRVDES